MSSEPRRLLSYFFYAQALLLTPLGLLVLLWAFFPAVLALDALVNVPDPFFALFTGGMALIPAAVGLLILLVAATQGGTGLLLRGGARGRLATFACALSFVVPPLGPILGAAGLILSYSERAAQ